LDRGRAVFDEYIQTARSEAGEKLWKKIKGFRFLLQAIDDYDKFRRLVNDPELIGILKNFGSNWTFDIGIDQRKGGVWQMEMAADLIEAVHDGVGYEDKVTFIIGKS
jgi:L-rhamnono-1,4-lactonase